MRPDTRRRVLFLIPSLAGGGAERVIVTLLKHLDRSRFNLTLAVVDMRGEVYRNELPDDIDLIELNAGRVRYALPKIISLIWKQRPDVVFSTLGHLNLALAIFRFLLPNGGHYVARETNIVSYGLQSYRYPWIWRILYCWFYKNHDTVVCQSRFMQDDLVAHYRVPRAKTLVINNPVDMDHIQRLSLLDVQYPDLPPETIRLVSAGRLSDVKGFDMLIRAISLLGDARIHLSLLGDGPLKNDLQCLAVSLGVSSRIFFAGFQPNPYAWFAKADAFVLSSRYEGFPNVVLEALACGTPVIANPAPGGIREILDGVQHCVIAEKINTPSLAEALAKWVNSERQRMPETVVARYAVTHIIRQYESIFDTQVDK